MSVHHLKTRSAMNSLVLAIRMEQERCGTGSNPKQWGSHSSIAEAGKAHIVWPLLMELWVMNGSSEHWNRWSILRRLCPQQRKFAAAGLRLTAGIGLEKRSTPEGPRRRAARLRRRRRRAWPDQQEGAAQSLRDLIYDVPEDERL